MNHAVSKKDISIRIEKLRLPLLELLFDAMPGVLPLYIRVPLNQMIGTCETLFPFGTRKYIIGTKVEILVLSDF